MKNVNWTNVILWGVYLSLLAVLLPHTAWTFSLFEPTEPGWMGVPWGLVIAWAAAIAFECSYAAMVHKLSKHIEAAPGSRSWKKRTMNRYANFYTVGLILAVSVSTLANLAHAVEFGRPIKLFSQWGIPFAVYVIAFGAILPTVSVLFARMLSNVRETEHEVDDEVIRLNNTLSAYKLDLKETEQRAEAAEQNLERLKQDHTENERHLDTAEQHIKHILSELNETKQTLNDLTQRNGDLDELAEMFLDGTKQERITAVAGHWPELPQRSIATLTASSVGYVNQTLNGSSNE